MDVLMIVQVTEIVEIQLIFTIVRITDDIEIELVFQLRIYSYSYEAF